MNKVLLALFSALLFAFQLSAAPSITYEERLDLQPNLNVRTPHFEFGRNLAGGPLKIYAISNVKQGRDVTELMQRLDSDIKMTTWDRYGDANAWGFGDFYARMNPWDYKIMSKYVGSSIGGDEKFDVMLLCTPMGWSSFTKGTKKNILKRVEEGAGLIFVAPFFGGDKAGIEWDDELRKLCALTDGPKNYTGNPGYYMTFEDRAHPASNGKKWLAKGKHVITDGVPLEALPFGQVSVSRYMVAEGAEVLLETEDKYPVMAVKTLGKGRVVTFAFRSECLTPQFFANEIERATAFPHRYWEPWFDLLARTCIWASGREFKKDGAPSLMKAEGEDADDYFRVKQWKDGSGKVTAWELGFTPPAVKTAVSFDLPLMLEHGKGIPISFDVPKGLESAKWTITASQPAKSGLRAMESAAAEAKDGKVSINFPGTKLNGTAVTFRVTGFVDGKAVAEGVESTVFSPDGEWHDWEIHCWGGAESLPFLRDFERTLEKQLGVTCQQTGSDNEMREALLLGYRNQLYAGIQGLHAKLPKDEWDKSKDKKWLIRNPSFTDKAELERRRQDVLNRFTKTAKYKPLSGMLADETSLTNYTAQFDFDWHPDNIAAFREALKKKFKNIDAMNKALNTAFKTFAEIEPPMTSEAKESGNWGLWNEWRSHNDDMWTAAFQHYNDWFKAAIPTMRMSLSGTQTSTPFNGIDWAKLTKTFGAITGYRGRYQDLQRMSFDPTEDMKLMSWVGYGVKGLGAHYQMWENLLTGDSGCGVFWWQSMRNADLSFCKSGESYKEVFSVLQSGTGRQFQLARRSFSPVAVLWSATSQRAAFVAGKFDDFVKVEADVVDSLRLANFDPYFVSDEQVAAGELKAKGVKALFLPMTLSLGMGEGEGSLPVWKSLKQFMDNGGVIVKTNEPERDEFLRTLKSPAGFEKAVLFPAIKEKLADELASRGVKAAVVVLNTDIKKEQQFKTYVHELRQNKKAAGYLVSFLCMPEDMKQVFGPDGVPYFVAQSGVLKPFKVTADCSALKYTACYDRQLGKRIETPSGKAELEVTPCKGNILAFLPYVVKGVSASMKNENGLLKVDWSIDREKSDAVFAAHAVRVDVIDAETGKANPDLSGNYTSDASGKGSAVIPMALAEAGKKWQVTVTDMITGMKTEVR